jgi:hypothetical protein
LYTASQMGLMGWMDGSGTALTAADGLFAGRGAGWMSDHF